MKQVYLKHCGTKISVLVTDKVENALTETRRAIWCNESKERYYYAVSLNAMTDKDMRMAIPDLNPETFYIATEEQLEHKAKLTVALKSLTPEQRELVKMLVKGMGIREIARTLGKHHSTVAEMRKAVQKKFENNLR